jgi:hypothetical protein
MKNILKALIMMIPFVAGAGETGPEYFYQVFPEYILTPQNLIEMKHSLVTEKMMFINNQDQVVELKEIGSSAEGRSINMLSFGSGKTKLLLWSQMHGDEPTATAGLLAVYYYLAKNFNTPFVQELHKNLTIHSIVMLNPDGAERYQRRNAQGIDINRDAQRLQSPEGKILKKMNDQIQPDFGFNLHDMRGRETVGKERKILMIALMAPPFNDANKDNPSRVRAKKLAVVIREALDKIIPGHVAKYKAGYMPRAFGDAFQNWGVSTVLIESGLPYSAEPHLLVRFNFVSLLSAFQAISESSLEVVDAKAYDAIPLEGIELFDMLIKNARIFNGYHIPNFVGDIGVNIDYSWQDGHIIAKSMIDDIGDLSVTTGRKIIEGNNLVVTPGFIARGGGAVQNNYQMGITTYLNDTREDKRQQIKNIPKDGVIDLNQLASYTVNAAAILGKKEIGSIEKDKSADLLVFETESLDKVSLKDLRYVIKNGEIVYEKK